MQSVTVLSSKAEPQSLSSTNTTDWEKPWNHRVAPGEDGGADRSHRVSRWMTEISAVCSWNQNHQLRVHPEPGCPQLDLRSPCGTWCHVSKVVTGEEVDLVLPVEEATTRVFNVFFVHSKAFLPVCARRVQSAGWGLRSGWWEMFVVQHWDPVHPDHLSPSL